MEAQLIKDLLKDHQIDATIQWYETAKTCFVRTDMVQLTLYTPENSVHIEVLPLNEDRLLGLIAELATIRDFIKDWQRTSINEA